MHCDSFMSFESTILKYYLCKFIGYLFRVLTLVPYFIVCHLLFLEKRTREEESSKFESEVFAS